MSALKVTLLLLLIPIIPDLVGNPNFFESKSSYPSELFLLISTIIFLNSRIFMNFKYTGFLKKIILAGFLATFALSILLTILDFINYPNFVYSITKINYPEVFFLSITLGVLFFGSLSNEFYKMKNNHLIFLSPVIILIIGLVMWMWPFNRMYLLTREDTLVEYLQFLSLIIASFYFLRSSLKLYGKNQRIFAILFILVSLALFFIAGEEISWGQRILSLQTPQGVTEINYQNEINLHNINSVAGYVSIAYLIIGLYGSVVSFLVSLFGVFKKRALFFPSNLLFLYFFFPFLHNLYISTHANHNLGGFSEINELILYLGMALFGILVFSTLKHSSAR